MSHDFDEFSKSLADESVPRRESLKRLGLLITASVLGPFALGPSAANAGPFGHAGHRRFSTRSSRLLRRHQSDPCQAFCKCRNSRQQKQCLATCRACNGETNRLAGSCGSYTCVSLSSDPHCGSINNNCGARGLTCCGGTCVDVTSDANNCGACGVVCSSETPFCIAGTCTADSSECPLGRTRCGDFCVDLNWDSLNCGACGNACPSDSVCEYGNCVYPPDGCEWSPYGC